MTAPTKTTIGILPAVIAAVLCLAGTLAPAQSPDADESLDAQLLGELEKDPAGGKETPQARDPLDDELAEQLDTGPDAGGEDVGSPGEDVPLVRLGHRMKDVERAIGDRDTSVQTQNKQEQIVRELSELIDEIKKNQCQGASKPSGGSKQPQPGGPSRQPGDKPTDRPAGESTQRTDTADAEAGEATDVDEVLRRVWGHLPAKIREQIQQTAAERSLPEYEKLVEDYFKRLAEDQRNRP